MSHLPSQLDYNAIRQRLARSQGRVLWQSLDELADSPKFEEAVQQEFSAGASEWTDPLTRRTFLKLMGASLALAGLYGCGRSPRDKIVPYVEQPERVVPGKALFFATAMPFGPFNGYGTGLIVESHEGRPTKIEGNPLHPASQGATTAFHQSSVLQLYDPDRSNVLLYRGNASDWGALVNTVAGLMARKKESGGAGLRILTPVITSPTFGWQMGQLLDQYKQAKWHQYDPVNRDNVYAATQRMLGRPLNMVYDFAKAKVVVALDSDFLFAEPGSVRYARDFVGQRLVRTGRAQMNRLYAVEPTMSITGAMADHRLPLAASQIQSFARALAAAVGVEGMAGAATSTMAAKWASAIADDLKRNRGAGLVLAGPFQPPAMHELAQAINDAMGNTGQTVQYTEPPEAAVTNCRESLAALVRDMRDGRVDMLLILGGNPAYTAPADVPFARELLRLSTLVTPGGELRAFTAHLSLYNDETSFLCQWHAPQTHYLEAWSDVRACDGTITIMQPLLEPLYRAHSDHEVLALLLGRQDVTSHQIVREHWEQRQKQGGFEAFWQTALSKGVVDGSQFGPADVGKGGTTMRPAPPPPPPATPPAAPGPQAMEIVFRPDPSLWDGAFANIGWQQELPKPFTKLVWDNAALISTATAQHLGNLQNGDIVTLTCDGRSMDVPVCVTPGQADFVVTLHLGYGRQRAGSVGNGVGFNAYALRTSERMWFAPKAQIRPAGRRHLLVAPHTHFLRAKGELKPKPTDAASSPQQAEEEDLSNRRLVRVGTLDLFRKAPDFAKKMDEVKRPLLSLYPGFDYEKRTPGGQLQYKWGMSIDTNACIGCNACVAACQSENNIPVVGKEQAAKGRVMHWLRIDQYYAGSLEEPQAYNLPVPCMQCENAPCEVVCPVGATVHDSEGINNMVYNRCVGTRYCSNNCPYKVRRFNFLLYSDDKHPTVAMQKNPNVSVRMRGVMEKCTYCIQRISEARIEAEKQDRRLGGDDVKTACQQVCPTQAIVFGDLNDPASQVRKLHDSPLDYALLEELTTVPRTRYLAKVRNPNPALDAEGAA